ncbi:MAG: DUF1311 domain-containing protein [Planctomycetes bacterium]|nr:DUF1311 domain-containing protein [Planctomycetota bacterium]
MNAVEYMLGREVMRIKFYHAALVALLLVGVSRAEDAVLRELEARLDSAQSQKDMNIASGKIAAYLDKKLIEKEAEIAKNLDPEGLRLFTEAAKLWRDYRLAQVSFEGDLYRGGTIRPLIHNRTFSRLTQERLSALLRIMEP